MMVKSMTGYGRCEKTENGLKITVEIRSVNHRYSDYSIKVPRYYVFLEDKVREKIATYIARGKVDVYVNIESYGRSNKEVIVDETLTKSYLDALYKLRDEFNLADDISVSNVARYTDIFRAERKAEDEDELWLAVESVTTLAAEDFTNMRQREGTRIGKDLSDRVSYMKDVAKKIDERSPQTVEEYRTRLYTKIKELLEDKDIDEARILTEVAIFADKVSVNEETVRLASHFDEFDGILNSGEPAGRRLDFLIQEINREVNTIGSKANDIEISKLVVELKGEIEKLREQIQNIE